MLSSYFASDQYWYKRFIEGERLSQIRYEGWTREYNKRKALEKEIRVLNYSS